VVSWAGVWFESNHLWRANWAADDGAESFGDRWEVRIGQSTSTVLPPPCDVGVTGRSRIQISFIDGINSELLEVDSSQLQIELERWSSASAEIEARGYQVRRKRLTIQSDTIATFGLVATKGNTLISVNGGRAGASVFGESGPCTVGEDSAFEDQPDDSSFHLDRFDLPSLCATPETRAAFIQACTGE